MAERDGAERRGPTRRRALQGAATGAGLVGLAGAAACAPAAPGGRGAPEGDQSRARTRAPGTLKLNYRTERYVPKRAEEFAQQHPWITVELLTDTGYEKLVAQIAAGDPGDVIWLSTGVGTYFEMAALGNLLDIGPLVAADRYDLKQQIAVGVETAKIVDGKLFGLPSGLHPSHLGLFYNVSLFETAGVAPPTLTTTHDELADVARKMAGGRARTGARRAGGCRRRPPRPPRCCASCAPSAGSCSTAASWGPPGPRRTAPGDPGRPHPRPGRAPAAAGGRLAPRRPAPQPDQDDHR